MFDSLSPDARRAVTVAITHAAQGGRDAVGIEQLVLALSLRESRQRQHNYVGSEHPLLGVLQQLDDPWAEPEPASEFLEQLGVDVDRLRHEILLRMVE